MSLRQLPSESTADVLPASSSAPGVLREIEAALASGVIAMRFSPSLEARYHAETRTQRIQDLRRAIFLGLVLFNVYDITGFITLPDFAWPNVILRAVVMTPTACGIAYLLDKVGYKTREALCAMGVLGATAIPTLFFLISHEPLTPFMSAEIMLSAIFTNIVVALRFFWATLLSIVTIGVMVACVVAKPAFGFGLSAAILLNLTTGIVFSLFSNFRMERGDRRSYLLALRERLRADAVREDNGALETLSVTDALTGLPNRRAFTQRLLELDHQARQGRDVAAIVLDVDSFKLYNDYYGHAAGDRCLRFIAVALRDVIHLEGDLVARLGGEEFVVLLLDRTSEEAASIAEALRRAVAALLLPHAGCLDSKAVVTVSLGVAGTDVCPDLSPSGIVEAADAALYEAKAAGRDRVRVASPAQRNPATLSNRVSTAA